MRATVVMEEGKTLDEDKVRDALGAKRLKFVSLEVVDRPIPKAMYNMKAKGVT
jgi:prolyl-tRNA editing enzyme YbaK/EbsC (Cys-tRNA(Pro) deacylase)